MNAPCDLCNEQACTYGPGGIKYCRQHQAELWAWKLALEQQETEALGGPFTVVGNCPRRAELGIGAMNSPLLATDDIWAVRDGHLRCSYCGSLHPDTFMDRTRAGDELGPTDKNYKVYLDGSSTKFYFQHLSTPQKIEFTDLVNDKAVNIGYPGHFYTRLFFWAPGTRYGQ